MVTETLLAVSPAGRLVTEMVVGELRFSVAQPRWVDFRYSAKVAISKRRIIRWRMYSTGW